MKPITQLLEHQVFCFSSNQHGFHGAGSAGFACRGTAANTWRSDPWFQKAMKAPVGSTDRIGKWAVFGVARGPQKGREGKSYAIQTIVKPGLRRSTPLSEIEDQLVKLCAFARSRPHLEFLMTPVGCGLAGWTPVEMQTTFDAAMVRAGGQPVNLVVPDDLYQEAP